MEMNTTVDEGQTITGERKRIIVRPRFDCEYVSIPVEPGVERINYRQINYSTQIQGESECITE